MKTQQEIFNHIVEIMSEEFEIAPQSITLDVNLYTELDLDSIDAVDLVVKLQEFIGSKIDPETFKKVRTVQDVVNAIDNLINT